MHLLFPCLTLLYSSQTMLCWPGRLSHTAPHRKDLKTSLEHPCDPESSGTNTLHPLLTPKAHDSDRPFTVSPRDRAPSPTSPLHLHLHFLKDQSLQPAGHFNHPRTLLTQCELSARGAVVTAKDRQKRLWEDIESLPAWSVWGGGGKKKPSPP